MGGEFEGGEGDWREQFCCPSHSDDLIIALTIEVILEDLSYMSFET